MTELPTNTPEDENRPGRRLLNPDVWAPALLVLLGILFFSDSLFSSKNFYFRDILNFHYPLRRVLIDSYARGELPLWNPFLYLGQPMLANPNYMAFYPTNLMHLFLPFNYAFKLHFILHPILAGVGLYFLQRRLGLPGVPALAGSIAYEFSGTVLSFLNLYNIIPAVALLPWIGWAFVGALEKNWLRRSLGLGAVLTLQVIALEPLTFYCSVWLLAGLTLFHFLESEDKIKAICRALRAGLVAGIFALGLASIQVLPTLELLPLSSRGSGFDFKKAAAWSMHPLDLLNMLVPNFFGRYFQIGQAASWGQSLHEGVEGYLVSFFLGTCAIVLAAASFCSCRKRLQTVMASVAVVGTFLALGLRNPVYHWLFDHVALLRLGRYPSKYFLLASLAIAFLASLGVEVVFDAARLEKKGRRLLLVIGSCGLVAGVTLLLLCFTWPSHVLRYEMWIRAIDAQSAGDTAKNMPVILSQLQRSLLSSGVFLTLASALIVVAGRRRRASLMGGVFLLLITAELLPANLRLAPLISDADVAFVPEVNKYLGRGDSRGQFRVVSPTLLRRMPDLDLRVPNMSSAWLTLFYKLSGQPYYGITNGIQYSLDAQVDGLCTMEADNLWRFCASLPEQAGMTLLAKTNSPVILSVGDLHDPRIRLIGTFDLPSKFKLNVYWLENTIGRVFFAPNVVKAASHSDALRKFVQPDFRFGNTVVLENPDVTSTTGSTVSGSVRIERYENQRVSCRVQAEGSGYLVLLDSFCPGWDAYLDGEKVEVLRADYAFRAVAVAAGSHEVEFRYRPASFYRGLALTLSFLFGGVLVALLSFIRRPTEVKIGDRAGPGAGRRSSNLA